MTRLGLVIALLLVPSFATADILPTPGGWDRGRREQPARSPAEDVPEEEEEPIEEIPVDDMAFVGIALAISALWLFGSRRSEPAGT